MADSSAAVSNKPAPEARPFQVKLVLLGEAAVGKSSVVFRFVQNDFQENKEPTIGAAFLTQKCRLEDKVIKFEIWDTAGQERFYSLAPMYYRNAQAAVVAYDVTKSTSLEKAKSWVKELKHQANPNIVIALIGTKIDLVQRGSGSSTSGSSNGDDEADDATATPENAAPASGSSDPNSNSAPSSSKRQVPKDEAEAYAKDAGLLFFETSAKTGEGVVEVFTQIASKIPLETILSSTRGSTGGAGSRSGSANRGATAANDDGRVNLSSTDARKKDACAC